METIDAYAIPGFREPINCFSHLFAGPIFAILGFYLMRQGRGNWGRVLSLAIMSITTVFLLSMSGVYHLLDHGPARYVMKQLDIAGVFALIAGTATPVHFILFRGAKRWVPILFIWLAAGLGITLRTTLGESLPPGVGTVIFVVLGWGGLFTCSILWRHYGRSFALPLLWGGVAYTLGAVVLLMNWPTLIPGVIGSHELWHLAVLVGLGLHWNFVFQFAGGPPMDRVEPHLANDG